MNPYEQLGRERKARTLADYLQANNWSTQAAEVLSPLQWTWITAKLGLNPPSDETIKLVIEQLRARAKLLPGAPDDPFAGIPS